jgi:hypothetical protein
MSNLATIVNNILADSGIDDINVVVTTGSYNNPAWITGLSWSKISSTPTTLSGYGITDAVPAIRTITINGDTQDLSANRTWTIAAGVTSVNAGTGISVNATTGAVTVTNTGVLSINGSTGAVTGIITTSNYNSYSPTLTGGGASGTWGISITGNADTVDGLHASAFLSSDEDSEQTAGFRYGRLNSGVARISFDPRWNESGYDADLGTIHIYSTTAAGANYGRLGIALYNGSAYQYLTTKASTTGLFVNNTQIVTNSGTWSINVTGTAASETLATVTARGASTSTTLTLARVITTGLYGPSTSGNIPIWQYDSSNPGYGIVYNEGSPDTLRIDVSGQALAGTPDVLIGGDYMQINGNTVLHAGNYNSYAPTLTGTGASGTWDINITGNSATASSTQRLDDVNNYTWSMSTLPTSYPEGMQLSFVGPSAGEGSWLDYGTVINARTYAGGGGSLQMYVPYGPNNGGIALRVRFGDYSAPTYGNQWTAWKTLLQSDNYTDYTVTKTGGGASGTWGINVTGSAGYTQTLALTSLGNGSVNVNNGNSAVYRTESGSGAVLSYSPVLHIGGGDTMWQVQGTYGTSGNGALYFRQGYNGSWGNWLTMLSSANYNSYSPTLTGGGASGTWGINITGNAATASSASSVAWSNISGGYRTNYDLGFRPFDNVSSYAGFTFATPGNDGDAGYLLIRGGADNDVYTENGITLVADKGWLTLAQRTTANRGVRIMTGTSSTVRISVTDSFSDVFNILSTRSGSTTVDNIRFYNQDGNYAYIRTTSAGNNNNPWYDGTLGCTMWYAWDNPGEARTAGVYTEHRFGNGRGAISEYVKVNRGRIYTYNSSDVATITLDGLTGKQSFSSANGTIISNASVTDMIGYNSTYQTYISGTATTIYATGIYYDGSGYRTLLHSANYNTYAVARYQTTQTGPNPVKIWNGHLASFSTNGSGNTYTIIQTSVPQDNYQMGGFTIEFFNNYSDNNQKTQIDLGGYWNAEVNGGFIGFEYHTSNPFVTPSIQVARNSSTGNVAFIITNANQSYQVVVARDLWLGYNSSSDSAWGTGWTIYETSSISGFTNNDGVVARVAAGSNGANASGTWGINVTGTAASETLNTVASRGATSNYPITISSTAGNTLRIIGASAGSAQIYATGANYGIRIDGASTSSSYYLANFNNGTSDVLYVRADGVTGVNTSDFAYTQNDNTPLVGSTTANKLFVSGSIQLNGNNDAIVFGRGTASFFKDEEIGFGWGGGWYMTDVTYLRVRNNKTIYTTGDYEGTNVFLKSNGSLELYVSGNTSFCHADARPNGNYATLHKYTYNPSLTTYGQYTENWWDGDSYHSISVSGNQFYFGAPVNATAFYESSDRRIKDLVQDDYRANGIESIRPKLYKKNGKLELGYYAQDVEPILPHAISVNDAGFLNLSYREVHTAKIAYLEDSIEEIKAKILYLENQLKTKQ